ncbi:MAG: hypothetical protein A2X86_10740 [Bdellovibrionales bacterium GWA2_49_15]|nr:MAG: hypothetical protein A2X86_10740 [Bdellovibrionales bacterium GWA2_49_15]HAZ11452.1 hypothetical protein [Bdellovibrionales bacterium]
MRHTTNILVFAILQLFLVSCDEVATILIQGPAEGSSVSATATEIRIRGAFSFPKGDRFISISVSDGIREVVADNSLSGSKGTFTATLPYAYSPEVAVLNISAVLKTEKSTDTKKLELKVEKKREAVANFTFQNRQDLGLYVGVLDGSASTAPEGKIVKYLWTIQGQTITTTIPTLKYDFPSEGRFPVTLTVKSQSGLTASRTLEAVVVVNQRPVAPALVNMGTMVSKHTYYLTLPAATDPDGDTIRYRLLGNAPVISVADCLKDNNNLECAVTLNGASGAAWIKYMAYDQYGDALNATQVEFQLTANVPPVLPAQMAGLKLAEDVTLLFPVNGGNDQNQDFITYQLFERPKHGQIRNCLQGNIDLECEYIPEANYYGSDSFSYRAFDGAAYSNPSKVYLFIDAVNDTPSFEAKNATVEFEHRNSEPGPIFLPMALDAEEASNNLSYKIITPPAHGQLEGSCHPLAIAGGAICSFIPEASYDGEDALTLEASDAKGAKDTFTLNFKIHFIPAENYAPTLPSQQIFRGNENERLSLELNKGTDRNRDKLKRIFVSAPDAGDLYGCFNSPTCTFIPTPGYSGTTSFTYKVNDGNLDSNTSTVKIIIEKTKPVKLFAGGKNTCALFSNHKFKCWGDNTYGQLLPFGITNDSYGTATDDTIASMKYLDLAGSKDLSIGDGFICAILYEGYVKCWGRNELGQLGVGDDRDYTTTPLSQIPYVQDSMGRQYRDFVKIRSASQGTCALIGTKIGRVNCWGKVADHQSLSPVDTKLTSSLLPGAEAQLEISDHRICVSSKSTDASTTPNGTVITRYAADDAKCIGDQFHPAYITGNVPRFRVDFPELAYNIGQFAYFPESMSMGGRYAVGTSTKYLILPMGRTVYSYLSFAEEASFYVAGFERYGRPDLFSYTLQNKTFDSYEAATQFAKWLEPVVGASFYPINENGERLKFPVYQNPASEKNVSKLTGGENHICALANGQVKCWGSNGRGQLGIDTGTMTTVGLSDSVLNSKAVGIASNVVDVAAGSIHTCAISAIYNAAKDAFDHDMFCWGDNSRGQFGMLMHNRMSKLPVNVFTTRYKEPLRLD